MRRFCPARFWQSGQQSRTSLEWGRPARREPTRCLFWHHSSWFQRWLTRPSWLKPVHQWNQLQPTTCRLLADCNSSFSWFEWWLVLCVRFTLWFTCRHINVLHISQYKNIFKATLKNPISSLPRCSCWLKTQITAFFFFNSYWIHGYHCPKTMFWLVTKETRFQQPTGINTAQ